MEVLTGRVVEQVLTEGCRIGQPPIDNPSGPDRPGNIDTIPQGDDVVPEQEDVREEIDDPEAMEALKRRYQPNPTIPDKAFQIPHLSGDGHDYGTLVVPGWIRERAAEFLFEESESEVDSIPCAILTSLAKVSEVRV